MSPIDLFVEAFWTFVLIILTLWLAWKVVRFFLLEIPDKKFMDKFIRETQDRKAIDEALKEYEKEKEQKKEN